MGLVRIVLERGDYAALRMGMEQRGYCVTIPGEVDDEERLFLLPVGTYWRAEPTDAEQMRIDATAAVIELGAEGIGARILATAGVTSCDGLPACEE